MKTELIALDAACDLAPGALNHHLDYNTYPPLGSTDQNQLIALRAIDSVRTGNGSAIVAHLPNGVAVTATLVCEKWYLDGFITDPDEYSAFSD